MKVKLDQFYTKQKVVKQLLEYIDCGSYDLVLEPSAGDGAFVKNIHHDNLLALDLEPAAPGIQRGDFFDCGLSSTPGRTILTIGNPPFGKNSSLAVKFFNHAAQFSDCIAFIVPRTFRKPSVINRLHANFHLIEEQILQPNAFYTPSGESYDVPTVFQIWEARETKREKMPVLKTHPDFDFVFHKKDPDKTREKSDFCIRRVGALAGKVFDIDPKYAIPSHYFIKENRHGIRDIMESLDWGDPTGPKHDTSGNPSISKNDLIRKYLAERAKIILPP